MSIGRQVVAHQRIKIRIQFARSYNRRILHFQRAGGRVARIGKQRFARLFALFVQFFKNMKRHHNFSPDFETPRVIISTQRKRNRTNGPHVGSNIVAFYAVAAGNSPHQLPVFVEQTDGRAVEFQLANVFTIFPDEFFNAVVEIGNFPFGIGITERQHRIPVLHLLKCLADVASHPLRG